MARYTGPKFKLDRREGTNLLLKGKRSLSNKHPIEKKGAVPPGQHGQRRLRRKRISDFGLQLREKQKVKRMYGVYERQFRRYFKEAAKEKGNTGEALMKILETRLDNTLFRLGLAPSRNAARQLVNHGHIRVDNEKVDIPSYNVKLGQLITLSEKAQKFPVVEESLKLREGDVPKWLKRQGLVGKVGADPDPEDLDFSIDKQLIIEYYSR